MENGSGENKDVEYKPEKITLEQVIYDPSKNVNLKIKEEELDISKKWMQTCDVNVYRESFMVEKSFTIPVKRVELVIKKKFLASDTPNPKDEHTEVIRIPLSEESVEFTKHNIALEDVSIYKHKIKDIKSIEAILKKEEAKVIISESLQTKS